MSASRLARQRADAPHICVACARPFVYPEFGLPEGGRWRVLLHCLSCDWFGERVLDDHALEDFERELDKERGQIELDLERLTQRNMREYHDRFIAALAADAILPEDF
jgi:hypothetical protein